MIRCLNAMPLPTELFTRIMGHIAPDSTPDATAAALRVWHTLFHKLAPLLGPLSADLLFMRSLAAHEAQFPWLPRVAPSAAGTAFREYERCLEGRPEQDIVAVNRALVSTYMAVLADLIGDGLAGRLLDAAAADMDTNKDTEE